MQSQGGEPVNRWIGLSVTRWIGFLVSLGIGRRSVIQISAQSETAGNVNPRSSEMILIESSIGETADPPVLRMRAITITGMPRTHCLAG